MDGMRRAYTTAVDVLWAIALIGLPLTSVPLIWTYLGAIVAPFSAIPVFILLFIWLIPFILRRGALPLEIQPAVVFLVVVVLTSAASFFLVEIPPSRDRSVAGEMLSAFVSLGIGSAFLFVFASLPTRDDRLRKTLRWIHLGGIVLVGWTLIQVYYVTIHPENFPQVIFRLQDLLVTHSPFSFIEGSVRVSGFAYEATWFAHQLNILYFPLWIGATYTGYSVFDLRVLRLSVENVLLIFGLVLFFFSSPRVGMIALLMMVMFIFVKINLRVYHRLSERISRAHVFNRAEGGDNRVISIATGLVSAVFLLAVYAGVLFLVLYVGSQRDWRLALLLSKPPNWEEISGLLRLDDRVMVWIGYRFAFLERTAYWVAGLKIFNQYPFTGVGLGNAGFFFPQEVPSLGWSSPEIRNMLLRVPYLPNIKSLWVRLLAEAGLVGFSAFLGWLYVLWHSTRLMMRGKQREFRALALTGQLSLIAFIAEGFSIDSFAMPYLWVTVGLVVAAGMVYRRGVAESSDLSTQLEEEKRKTGMGLIEATGD